MFDFIEALIRKQVSKVENHHGSELLCGQVLSRFSEALHGLAMTVSQSTVTQMLVRQVGDSNPLAYLDPALLTEDQRRDAEKAVKEALISGLSGVYHDRIDYPKLNKNKTNAFGDTPKEGK